MCHEGRVRGKVCVTNIAPQVLFLWTPPRLGQVFGLWDITIEFRVVLGLHMFVQQEFHVESIITKGTLELTLVGRDVRCQLGLRAQAEGA